MRAQEFGQQNPEVILLLHGGGLSWWNYREAAAILAQHCHVVLPVLDGHADSDAPFTAIEENAAKLISWIDTRFGGQVLAMGGLSLGGQIVVEMLTQRPDICRCALIESAPVSPMKLTNKLIGPALDMSYGLIRKRWFAKLQAAYLRIPGPLFEDYYRDTCGICKTDMITFLRANSSYALKPSLSKTTARVKILAGTREQKSVRDSGKLLQAAIPESCMELLPGLHHGELSLGQPEAYAQLLIDWIRREK